MRKHITGNHMVIREDDTSVVGNNNIVTGCRNTVTGNNNVVFGNCCYVAGKNSFVDGEQCTVTGDRNVVVGKNMDVTGSNSELNGQPIPIAANTRPVDIPVAHGGASNIVSSAAPPLPLRTKLPMIWPDEPDSAENGQSLCTICIERGARVVAVPCGHNALCVACTCKFLPSTRRSDNIIACVICREDVTEFVRIFSQ